MREPLFKFCGVMLALVLLVGLKSQVMPAADAAKKVVAEQPAKAAEPDAKLKPLNPEGTVLLDLEGKRLLLKTKVALREGQLELLCCLKQTKEHESILALDSKAYVVHTGLVALKAKTGKPARFEPKFEPPTGHQLKVYLSWVDDDGKAHRVAAQTWVRHNTHRWFAQKLEKLPAGLVIPDQSNLRYDTKHKELSWYGPMTEAQKAEFQKLNADKPYQAAIAAFHEQSQNHEMEAQWVFTGSGIYKDDDGKNHYLAEDGDLISVANFSTATIDVAIRSSAQNDEGLSFESWTERIPPKGTPVTIELMPVFEAEKTEKPAAKDQ